MDEYHDNVDNIYYLVNKDVENSRDQVEGKPSTKHSHEPFCDIPIISISFNVMVRSLNFVVMANVSKLIFNSRQETHTLMDAFLGLRGMSRVFQGATFQVLQIQTVFSSPQPFQVNTLPARDIRDSNSKEKD